MRLVIDTNRLLAALIRSGTTREIIHSNKFEFFKSEGALEEVLKHRALVKEKSGLSDEELETLYSSILLDLELVEKKDIEPFMHEAEELMKDIDPTDSIFIACALAIKADGIFSEDVHFDKQNRIKIFKTEDIIKLL